jgi:hypothetical protein
MIAKLKWGISIGRETIAFCLTRQLAERLAQEIANELGGSAKVEEFDRILCQGDQLWIQKEITKGERKKTVRVDYPVCQSQFRSVLERVQAKLGGTIRNSLARSNDVRIK